MSNVFDKKASIISEVLPLVEQLNEINLKLSEIPRSTVATRQLSLIVGKLQAWHKEFIPRPQQPDSKQPSREEIDAALIAYRERGYFKLSERQKFVVEWFDKHYRVDEDKREGRKPQKASDEDDEHQQRRHANGAHP